MFSSQQSFSSQNMTWKILTRLTFTFHFMPSCPFSTLFINVNRLELCVDLYLLWLTNSSHWMGLPTGLHLLTDYFSLCEFCLAPKAFADFITCQKVMSWSLFLTFLSLLFLSCFWCRSSIRHMGHKAGFHLCLEGSTRGAKRKVAEIFRTWKSFVCLRDEDKCPPKITWDPCTDSSSLKGFSRHLRGCLFVCLFSFYLLLMEYDSQCMPKVKVKVTQ